MQKLIVLPSCLLCCMVLGCGVHQPIPGHEAVPNVYTARPAKSSRMTTVASDDAQTTAATGGREHGGILETRKLVYKGYFTLVVGDITAAQSDTQQMAEELGGYLHLMQEKIVIIRVPAARFNDAIKALSAIGTVAKRRILAQDVTEKYLDQATRLKNAKALAGRLRKLLDDAKNIKESLKIEHELARVQLEIDKLEGQIKLLDNQVAYATLEIAFKGIVAYTPPKLRVKLPISWLNELGLNSLLRFGGRELY